MANAARPAAGVRLCALAELKDPGSRGFYFRDGDALFMGFVVRSGGGVAGWERQGPVELGPEDG